MAAGWWPERVERVTGVSAADQRAAVHMLAGRSYVLTGRGTEQHATGTDNVSAWINLALALGLPGPRRLRVRLPDRAGQRPGRP